MPGMMPSTLTCNSCGADNQPKAAFCRSCGSSLQAVKPTLYNSATGRLLANVLLKQRYRIIGPVGKGGMGAVYKAEDTQLGNRRVALKEMSQSGLSPQEQQEAADTFRQEALMLARLQHPSLPNIFDHFEENGRWYLAMSFIEGETLEDYLGYAQGGKLLLEEVLQIGIQLCSVLSYLHNQQPAIIFRDLKPANIMRTLDGHIYLIDFGIARHFKPGQAKDTAYYGSMGYAPPEQYGKAQTTPRSDIYSLGATLYQLISGHDPSSTPFRFPLLQSLVPTAPADLAAQLAQMLELDEDKRPASMLLVKQELQTLSSSLTQKPGPRTPVPGPSAIPPTLPANPKPSPGGVAPIQPAYSPVPAASAQPVAKSASIWAFGKRQVVATLILAGCYCAVYYIVYFLLPQPGEIVTDFEFSPIFFLPVFFASFFGPWVGIGATDIGFLLVGFIESLVQGFHLFSILYYSLLWLALSLMLAAFFAGLFLLKTKGQYHKFGNLLFASLLGLLDICLALIVYDIVFELTYPGFNPFSYFFTNVWTTSLSALICLPLLLLISNAIRNAYMRKHP
jgi:serine/threonine protein kinase